MGRFWFRFFLIVSCLLLLFGYQRRFFERWTSLFYDFCLKSGGSSAVESSPLLVVRATENFVRVIGHKPDRGDYADLLRRLKKGGVRLVLSDFFFSELGDPGKDNALRQAIREGPPVILPVFTFSPFADVHGDPVHTVARETLRENNPFFQREAASLGHINMLQDADKIVRKCPAFISDGRKVIPQISLEAYRVIHRLDRLSVGMPRSFGISPEDIPLDETGCLLIRFFPDPEKTILPKYTCRMEDILRGTVRADLLKGKIVLIGQTMLGEKNADVILTPFGPQFGVFVQFQALYTVFSGFPIRPVGRFLPAIVALLVLLILLFSFSFPFRHVTIIFFTLTALLVAGSYHLFSLRQIFFDPVPAFLNGWLAYVSYAVLHLMETKRELSRGEHFLTVLDRTQQEIAVNLRPREIPGLGKTILIPTLRDDFIRRTPEMTIQTISSLLGVAKGCMFIFDEATGRVTVIAGTPWVGEDLLKKVPVLLGDREYLVLKKKSAEEFLPDAAGELLLCSILNKPALEVYGIFADKQSSSLSPAVSFSRRDYQWIMAFGLQTVVAFFNTRLMFALQNSQLETISRLAVAIEYRDRETGMHIHRISEYATVIASRLGFSDFEVELIRSAMPLHDLGKIAIPDHILLKPGLLDPEERKIIESHPLAAGKMLQDSDSFVLQAAHLIALYHHERFDGKGYPFGLAGTAIPLYGRIAALVDVFDAMCSRRVYKEALPFEESFNAIVALKGSHFDPKIIEVFLEQKEEIRKIYDTYQEKPQPDRESGVRS